MPVWTLVIGRWRSASCSQKNAVERLAAWPAVVEGRLKTGCKSDFERAAQARKWLIEEETMNSEPGFKPIARPQRLFALWSMILIQIVLPLALSFDGFIWWRGHKGLYFVGDIMLVVLGPLFIWMIFAMIWSGILEKKPRRPITWWNRVCAGLCGVLDLLLVAFIIPTTFVALFTIQSENTRLVGYFVPGGHIFFTGSTGASSINNTHDGTLTITWLSTPGNSLDSTTYKVSGGTDTTYNMVSGDTLVRHGTKLPAGYRQGISMIWSSSGTVMTFPGNKSGELHAGGPGVGITVRVEDNPYAAQGSLAFPDRSVYGPVLDSLVRLKESNRVLLWVGAFVLLFLTDGCLLRAGILGNMFDQPDKSQKVEMPAK